MSCGLYQSIIFFCTIPKDLVFVSQWAMCAAITRMLDDGKITDDKGSTPYLLQHIRVADRLYGVFISSYSAKKKSKKPFAAPTCLMNVLKEAKYLLENL